MVLEGDARKDSSESVFAFGGGFSETLEFCINELGSRCRY